MDKYEYKIREDEIKELIEQRDFAEAAEVADTIDWRRVKSVKMLCLVSDVYKKMRRYEDSRDMLLLAYDRHPGGRTIVYSLCELAIKMGELGQALEYCKEFIQIAPKDPGRYILQYKLYEAQEVGLEERIAVLEELKKKDYREKWAYELAFMYHKVGMETRCVEECDELILWFGEGKYVIKAMELKMQHQPLSELQQEKYDSFFRQEEEPEEMPEAPQENVMEAETTRVPVADIDIQVKTLGLSQADTINLQAEVAAGLQELLAKQGNASVGYEEDAPTRRMTAPMGKVIDWATAEMVTSEIITDVEAVTMQMPQPKQVQKVIEQVAEETVTKAEEVVIEEPEEEVEATLEEVVVPEESVEEIAETLEEATEELTVEEPAEETNEEIVLPETLDWQAEESSGSVQEPEQLVLPIADVTQQAGLNNVEPPKEMAKVLSMEGDGQISFVMPETVALEKQITGQMNFNDIMLEWERMKLELEAKRKENVRQIVLRNTGAMFTEFEASVRDGLLEQLENGKTMEEILPQAENLDPAQVEALVDTEDNAGEYEDIKDTVEELTDIEEEIPEAVEDFEELGEIPEFREEEDEVTEEIPEAVEEFEELEEVAEIPEIVPDEDVSTAIEEIEEPEAVEEAMEDAEEAMDIVEEFVEEVDDEDSDAEDIDDAEADDSHEDEEDTTEDVVQDTDDEDADERDVEDEKQVNDEASEEEKEPTSGRSLTKEEKELFAPYIQGRESRQQLIQALDAISLAAYTGNVVITGREGLDTIGLAKSLIREVQQNDDNFSGKVAKISGASLNKRDVEEIVSGLVNGALIVQKAGDIKEDTAKSLYKILQQENRGIIVILEGTKRAINTFFEKYGLLESCFNARIDMEALSDDALVAFANKYAREHECSIDEFGMLALHRTIADRQTSDHAVTILEVKEIMDDAIASANRKTIGHFFSILAAKRYDDEDMIIIRENDFV